MIKKNYEKRMVNGIFKRRKRIIIERRRTTRVRPRSIREQVTLENNRINQRFEETNEFFIRAANDKAAQANLRKELRRKI